MWDACHVKGRTKQNFQFKLITKEITDRPLLLSSTYKVQGILKFTFNL